MGSEMVSLGVWESKEIIYHYDFIPSSTLFRSMKFRIFPESEIVHRKTTVVLIHFVRKRRSFFKEKNVSKTTVVFVQNVSKRPSFFGELFQIRGKCVTSQHVLELKEGSQYGCPTVNEFPLTSFNTFQSHFVTKMRTRVRKLVDLFLQEQN